MIHWNSPCRNVTAAVSHPSCMLCDHSDGGSCIQKQWCHAKQQPERAHQGIRLWLLQTVTTRTKYSCYTMYAKRREEKGEYKDEGRGPGRGGGVQYLTPSGTEWYAGLLSERSAF